MTMKDKLEEAEVEYVPDAPTEYEEVELGACFMAPVGINGELKKSAIRRLFRRAIRLQTLDGVHFTSRPAAVVEWSAKVYSDDAGVWYHVPQFAVVDVDRLRKVPEGER